MKIITVLVCFFSFILIAPQFAKAQDIKAERIKASYLLAYGRLPLDAELNWWKSQNDFTVSQLVETHRNYMNRTSPGSKDDVIKKTYLIAFGRDRNVQTGEINHWKGRSEVFWEMFPYHVRFLSENLRGRPDIYEDVIKNAYNMLFKKPASATELGKWKSLPVNSFAELIFILYKNPPAGYNVDPSALLTAMMYYKDFSNITFSNNVVNEIIAITGGADLYNKFKRGM
ncbi:MAG: hypothetical protein LH615_12240 [Ferruginibacter sp.]|nr:hypothetical protein [Ferruginibacter sp.]